MLEVSGILRLFRFISGNHICLQRSRRNSLLFDGHAGKRCIHIRERHQLLVAGYFLRYFGNRLIRDIGNRYLILLREEGLGIFERVAKPLSRRHYFLHTQLAVAVQIHRLQRFLADLQTRNRTTQYGPHFLVQLTEMTEIIRCLYTHAGGATYVRKTPFVLSHNCIYDLVIYHLRFAFYTNSAQN